MWKLRLLNFIAARLGAQLVFNARFFDAKSQSRGRTLWTTDDVNDAIASFQNDYRLNREKANGINILTIEAQFKTREWTGLLASNTDDDQLPLPIREPVQDDTQAGPDGTGAQEVEDAQAQGTGGGGAVAGFDPRAEAPADPERPVEGVKKLDLSDLGVR